MEFLFQGYLKVLGLARTAEVMRDARIGEAQANMEAQVRQFKANEELSAHQFTNKAEVAESERTFMLQKADFDKEVAGQKAISDFAYQLQENITRQKIREEEIETTVSYISLFGRRDVSEFDNKLFCSSKGRNELVCLCPIRIIIL